MTVENVGMHAMCRLDNGKLVYIGVLDENDCIVHALGFTVLLSGNNLLGHLNRLLPELARDRTLAAAADTLLKGV